MPTVALIQTSFNAGELSPLAYGRVDFPKYGNAGTLMQNFVPQVQGGLTRRTGSVYETNSLGHVEGKLHEFVFSTGDAVMLEFTDTALRFHSNRQPVYEAAQGITGVTQANPGVLSYGGADNYANGDEVHLFDILGMVELNDRKVIVANVNTGANTFELTDLFGVNIDTTGMTAYSSGGQLEKVYEIVSPYILSELPNLRFLQSRDVMYIVHPDQKPQKLSRAGATSWSFADIVFQDGPYQAQNKTTTTLTPAATTGTGINVTASSTTGINGGVGFEAADVGRQIRVKHSSTWGSATIVSITSTTIVVVDIDVDFPFGATTAQKGWRLGEWCPRNGYPSIIFSFEDRIGYGASPAEPVTLNMSRTGDYDVFSPTATDGVVLADHALQLKANQKRNDPIRWAFDDEKGLICGTKGAEFVARSSTTGEAMSAINFPALRRSTKRGSAFVDPVEVGKAILFVQASKRKVREIAYSFDVDGFRSPDVSILASHATKSGVEEMAFQQEPYSIVWVRRADGQLWGLTYEREQEVIGWHRHILGGYSDAGGTLPPVVESIATMPSPDGTQDDLWMIVKRYVDGQTVRHIEYLSEFEEDYDDVEDCFFVDSGKTITLASPGALVIGLDHLEGETLTCLVDGSPHPLVTVTDGAVTLDRDGTLIHVGFNYTSRFQNLRPEGGSRNGTSQGKTKRAHKVTARFHQTVGIWAGREFDNANIPLDAQDFRPGNQTMGQPVPLFSGDKQIDYEDDYNLDGYICLETRQPLPCTILALMPQIKVEDAQ